jgi:hypothetical protein
MYVCIVADGPSTKPSIIVERHTSHEDMRLIGCTEDKVHLSVQAAAFMTKNLQEEWAKTVFVPDLQRHKAVHQYNDRAFLLLDSLTCDRTRRFLDGCGEANVLVNLLMSHSRDQTQPLDLLIFALANQHDRTFPPNDLSSDQSHQVDRMMSVIHGATIVYNCGKAFMRAGTIPERCIAGHYSI